MDSALPSVSTDSVYTDPLVGRTLDGRYHVRSRIAHGGMATVYLASDTRLDRLVALKVMHAELARDAEFISRFSGEARSVARLSHPNIVQVFDQGDDGSHLYLTMEFVPGRTLRSLLHDRGWLPPDEALDIMIPVLSGLAAAHQAGIVHRDIKPENVLLTPEGRVKVVDFGLARAQTDAGHTKTGLIIGTVAYLAPEQVAKSITDTRTDVYAAGVMLFELLTGRQPHTGDTPMAVVYKHVNEDVPPPSAVVPGIPGGIDRLVLAATSRDPQHRPPDAGAFLRVARAVRGETLRSQDGTSRVPTYGATLPASPASYAPEPREPFLQRWLFSKRLAIVLIALLLIAGAGGGAWYYTSGRYASIPSVTGDSQSAATAALTAAGFKVASSGVTLTSNMAKGTVLQTQPTGRAVKGSVITLVLSGGPKMIAIPTVSGKSLQGAEQTLRQDGLTVSAQLDKVSSTDAAGTVIGTSPTAGTSWPANKPVTIVVAAGAPLPNFVGQNVQDVQQWAQQNHVQLNQQPDPASTKPHGIITRQSVPVGTAITAGMSVTVYVSNGPKQVRVPNVDGMTIERAQRRLEHDGFQVNVDQITPLDKVFRYSPGGVQPRGTVITIWAGL
jgi:beta-lactam-binding protein with PASTA domain/tRNA A-37 threonylcarbamoyl transferase component Bud32